MSGAEIPASVEVPVWEPDTKGRAIDSVPWERGGSRWVAPWLWLLTVVVGGTFTWLWGIGAPVAAVVFFGVLGAIGVLSSLIGVALWVDGRSSSRLLESGPWRHATVQVLASEKPAGTYLLIDGDAADPLWLDASPTNWDDQQILARTGRIWLVGPDENGNALICSAGTVVGVTKVTVITDEMPTVTPVIPEQVAPVGLATAGDDVILAKTNLTARRFLLISASAMALMLILVLGVLGLVLTSHSESHRVEGVVSVGVVATFLTYNVISIVRSIRSMRWVDRLLAAGPWTSVPMTLPVDTKLQERSVKVRGRATLPDGTTVAVRLKANYRLVANIAATGLLWVAGEPAPGRTVAAGLPGYPMVVVAHFGTDRGIGGR